VVIAGRVQNPPTALSPSTSLYLNFIEEFSIQQGQLLSNFMTVEIMQCPWPVENKQEVPRLRKCDLFSYLSSLPFPEIPLLLVIFKPLTQLGHTGRICSSNSVQHYRCPSGQGWGFQLSL
uniref:Uncharacterized protein n=1 Tax=Serinus canaria TaxID=9135 RepID=A0A8C9MLH6_SERCA